MIRTGTWMALALFLLVSLWPGAALADQKSFRTEGGKSLTFFGYLQYCNAAFIQGYLGQLGHTGYPNLFFWRGRPDGKGGTSWHTIAKMKARYHNPEGQAVLGKACGFAVNFDYNLHELKAGDRIRIDIEDTAEGLDVSGWTMWERTIGDGPDDDSDPEAQGGQFVQGGIEAVRPDSVRGFAFDQWSINGRKSDVYPVQVEVAVARRKLNSDEKFEEVATAKAAASEKSQKPLFLGQDFGGKSTEWAYGFTAYLPARLEPGNEYQITLSQVSLGKSILDKRLFQVSSEETLPAIASYVVGKGEQASEGTEFELDWDWTARKWKIWTERMTTRSLLSKAEFHRKAPWQNDGDSGSTAETGVGGFSGLWKNTGGRLYSYDGEGEDFQRFFLAKPGQDPLELKTILLSSDGWIRNGHRQGVAIDFKGKGGYSAESTRSLWLKSIETNPSAGADAKVYVYEWGYLEPWIELQLIGSFMQTKLAKLPPLFEGLQIPGAAGEVVDPSLPAPATPTSTQPADTLPGTVTNGWISIAYSPDSRKPIAWQDLSVALKEQLIARHGPRLDEEFNVHQEVEFSVGAFSKQVWEGYDAQQKPLAELPPSQRAASAQASGLSTSPSAADTRSAKVTLKVTGNHWLAWFDREREPEAKAIHPLYVSVRWVYEHAYHKMMQ